MESLKKSSIQSVSVRGEIRNHASIRWHSLLCCLFYYCNYSTGNAYCVRENSKFSAYRHIQPFHLPSQIEAIPDVPMRIVRQTRRKLWMVPLLPLGCDAAFQSALVMYFHWSTVTAVESQSYACHGQTGQQKARAQTRAGSRCLVTFDRNGPSIPQREGKDTHANVVIRATSLEQFQCLKKEGCSVALWSIHRTKLSKGRF